jgi:hypothetical protein
MGTDNMNGAILKLWKSDFIDLVLEGRIRAIGRLPMSGADYHKPVEFIFTHGEANPGNYGSFKVDQEFLRENREKAIEIIVHHYYLWQDGEK